MLKAAYRFFDNGAIEPQNVLRQPCRGNLWPPGHGTRGLGGPEIQPKLTGPRTPPPRACGPLGHSACQGLLVHSTLAFTPERVPLGLMAQQVSARDPADIGKRARRKQLPISQKESQKWLTSLAAVVSAHDGCTKEPLCQYGRPGSRCLRRVLPTSLLDIEDVIR